MGTTNIYEAKTQLSRLLERVERGEEIVIARAGKPVARLVPYAPEFRPRASGQWADRAELAPDFDELPRDLLKAFGVEG